MRGKSRRKAKNFSIFLILILLIVSICLGLAIFFYFEEAEIGFLNNNKEVNKFVLNYSLNDFSKELSKANFKIKKIEYMSDESGIRAIIEDDIEVIFSHKKNPSYQVASLQEIFLNLTMNNVHEIGGKQIIGADKKVRLVDFRFSKPIVKL